MSEFALENGGALKLPGKTRVMNGLGSPIEWEGAKLVQKIKMINLKAEVKGGW